MPGRSILLCILAIAASGLASASAYAQTAKKIRDWDVTCGKDYACRMTYDSGAGSGFDSIGLRRGGEPNAEVSIRVSVPARTPLRSDKDARFVFTIDGNAALDVRANSFAGPVEGTIFALAGNKADQLLSAMEDGQSMEIAYIGALGHYRLAVPLSGVTGALLFIDEVQQRLKRLDALQDKGDLPVPLGAPREDILHVAELPERIRADFEREEAECYVTDERLKQTPGFVLRYGDGLSFIVMPCNEPGAYNQPYAIYGGYDENVARISFPVMDTGGPTIFAAAFNISYDAAKGELSSFHRGRGIGDCGSIYRWRLQGRGALGQYLHLAEQRSKDSCDGNDLGGPHNWPAQWPLP